MKALWFEKKLAIKEIPVPVPRPGESLIKILMAGICNTDIEITKGYMNFTGVPGHEFVGIVETSNDSDLMGKRIVGEINLGCGKCDRCLQGLQRHCAHRSVLGILQHPGVFAEYITLPDINLTIVPDSVTDEQAVFVEPLAAALEITEQVHIKPEDHVAVIGDGKLALLIIQVLRLSGCHCTIFGKHEEKLAIAEKFGARCLLSDQSDISDKFDIIVEASGSDSGMILAQQLIKPRGTIVLKTTIAGDSKINMAQLVIDEITVVGSRCGQFGAALRLLEQKLVDPSLLIEKIYPFKDMLNAFDHAVNGSLKILLNFK